MFRSEQQRLVARVFLSLIVVVGLPSASLALNLTSYNGLGSVFVLSDGTLILSYEDPNDSRPDDGLKIDRASEHLLISNGTTYTLLPPWEGLPLDTVSRQVLNGDGGTAVAEFFGTLALVGSGGDDWLIEVSKNGTVLFEYEMSETGIGSSRPSSCSVRCSGDTCSCSGPGICICFCGLFETPTCVNIRLFQITVTTGH